MTAYEHAAFRARELRFHRYAYLFVDGVNVKVRLGEDPKLCLLVVIGVREDGEKELLAVEDGYREVTVHGVVGWARGIPGVCRECCGRATRSDRDGVFGWG